MRCTTVQRGLKAIATRVHRLTVVLAAGLTKLGFGVPETPFFDTLAIEAGEQAGEICDRALNQGINLRRIDATTIGISLDETATPDAVMQLLQIFAGDSPMPAVELLDSQSLIPTELVRTSDYLTHPVFNSYHSETEMLRYMYALQMKDLSLASAMIPLGSCTMKLNATAEMIPVTWPEFGQIHPFAPLDQAKGYQVLFEQLETWLSEITGFAGISLQPNAGSQGEYAGLLVIRQYHQSRGDGHRTICLIPQSAHGTNPASAVMAGMKVVGVKCDDDGNIDVADLAAKAEKAQRQPGRPDDHLPLHPRCV